MAEDGSEYFATSIDLGISLEVTDMERSLVFYRDCLGFDVVRDEEDPGSDRRLATLRFGNAVLDLVMVEPPVRYRPAARLFWVVEKIPEAVELIEDSGGHVQRTMEYGVHCVDPDGHPLLVIQKEPDVDELSI